MLATPPTSASRRLVPLIMPAASIAPIMLVEHAITVDSAVIVAGAPASISTSRAMLLHVRFGTTLPQIAKRSEEHTSELQSLMRISYAVFCLNKKKQPHQRFNNQQVSTFTTH